MKKILATLMSFVFVCSVCSTTVLAVENRVTVDTSANTMIFKTELLMSETAITAPAVDFAYTITCSTETLSDESVILAGIINTDSSATTFPTVSAASFTTSDFVDPTVDTDTAQTLSKNVTVDFSNITWTTTGIYHYTITATDMSSTTTATGVSGVDGIVMDDETTREIYVYVVNSDTANSDGSYNLVIGNIIMTTEAITTTEVDTTTNPNTSSLKDGTKSTGFLNGYGVDPTTDPGTGEDPDKVYEDFIVTVNVAGTMADRNKDFTVDITSTDGITDGTIFTVTDADGGTSYIKWDATNNNFITVTYTAATDNIEASWTDGADFTSFNLKDGETYTIHSVVNDMVFKTTITDEDNYTIYSNIDGAPNSQTETLELTNKINAQDPNVDDSNNYIPTYDLTIPDTGVILDILPYVIMVLLAAAFITVHITVSIKKSRRD